MLIIKSIEDFENLSAEINWVYEKKKNYLIIKSKFEDKLNKYCIIYFSSDYIFYPHTKEACFNQIIKNDRYEWYNTRIKLGNKHIFVRDIRKRHFLTGINRDLDTIGKVTAFLRSQTKGYKVITIGSSAGGYAAVFFGQELNAERIYTFNGQFLLNNDYIYFFSEPEKLLAKPFSNLNKYLIKPSTVFYFCSNSNIRDRLQFDHVKDTGINIFSFNTRVHGVPFLKNNLPVVLNLDINKLKSLSNMHYDPVLFSLKMVGVWGTIVGSCKQIQELIVARSLIRTFKDLLTGAPTT